GRFTIGLLASEEISSLRRATDAISASALTVRRDSTLVTGGTSHPVTAYAVSEEFFELFGLPMAQGHTFAREDFGTAPAGAGRVVLSHHAWQAFFGGDPGIVGRTISDAGGGSAIVVGVAPETFRMPRDADLWFAQKFQETIGHGYDAYLRFKPGRSP